jgi:hypothetical protein
MTLARQIRRYSDARAGQYATDGALPAPVAQRIEQQPSNLSVVGSIPTGGAIVMSQDIGDTSNPQFGFGRGLAGTSGLVVDGWVED